MYCGVHGGSGGDVFEGQEAGEEVAECSAGEDAEADEEGGEDEFDGWCDASQCYMRMGLFLLLLHTCSSWS